MSKKTRPVGDPLHLHAKWLDDLRQKRARARTAFWEQIADQETQSAFPLEMSHIGTWTVGGPMTQLCAADCHRPVVAGRSTGHPIWRKFAKQKTEDKSFLLGEAPSGGGWIHLVSAARRGVCSRIDIRKRRVVVVGGQRIDPQPARTKSTVQVNQTASGSRRRQETASCLFSSQKNT